MLTSASFSNEVSDVNLENNITESLILVEPQTRGMINTLTPTFKWRKVSGDNVEYRILITEWDGKVIIDHWVGDDTTFVVSNTNLLTDLTIYLWSISVYKTSHYVQSVTSSFYVDLDVSLDLEIINFKLISEKNNWQAGDDIKFEIEVLNCGPVPCFNAEVLLLNGNVNKNYYSTNALKKTKVLDTAFIDQLHSGMSYKVKLQGKLSEGLNHFYAEVKTRGKYFDLFLSNNFKSGPLIQTFTNKLQIKGLFVTYINYIDPQKGVQTIRRQELDSIFTNILNTQKFFWEHTQILHIEFDTLLINRSTTDNDFIHIDDNWGYILSPKEVENDLRNRNIAENSYDFVFVYYSWYNSANSWSGYRGYTFGTVQTILGSTAFAAQPVFLHSIGNEKITIHEILHIIDHFYKKNNNKLFCSPDETKRYTTFTREFDYYEWILETWPSIEWFNLNWGKKIIAIKRYEDQIDLIPKNLMLYQNYPNPFNNSTIISYELKSKDSITKAPHVSLMIYSLLGERVCTLVDDYQKPGVYFVSWDGKNDSGEPVSSGIYLYKISIGETSLIKKLLLLK